MDFLPSNSGIFFASEPSKFTVEEASVELFIASKGRRVLYWSVRSFQDVAKGQKCDSIWKWMKQ